MPNTSTGSGSASTASACRTQAACAIGQLIKPMHAVLTAAPFPTVLATCRRSLPVSRAPAGNSAICSVNALRAQSFSRQAYCTLCQRTTSRCSP